MGRILGPRRILTALAITVLLWTTSAGAAVFLFGGSPDIPEIFSVPDPQAGDQGNYTYSYMEMGPDGPQVIGETVPYLSFAWLSETTIVDVHGEARQVQPVWEQHWRNGFHIDEKEGPVSTWTENIPETRHVDDGGVIAFEQDFGKFVPSSGSSDPLDPIYTTVSGGMEYVRFLPPPEERTLSQDAIVDVFGYDQVACGLLNPFQGNIVELSHSVPLTGPCGFTEVPADPERPYDLPYYEFAAMEEDLWDEWPLVLRETDRIEAVGSQEVEGRTWVLFRASADDRDVRFWFDPQVPYPVQVSIQNDPGVERYHVIRLERFVAGGPADPRSGLSPIDPIATGPVRPWGIDEAGIDHYFPASAAWQAALDDGLLSDYLSSHDAEVYQVSSSNRDWTTTGERQQVWSFWLSEGTGDSWGVTIEYQQEPVLGPTPGAWLLPVYVGSEPNITVYPADDPEFSVGFMTFSRPPYSQDWLPDSLPSVQGLGSAMREILAIRDSAAADRPLNSWGLFTTCAEWGEDDCLQYDVKTWVGSWRIGYRDPAVPGEDRVLLTDEIAYTQLGVTQDGRLDNLQLFLLEAKTSVRGDAPLVMGDAPVGPVAGEGWLPPAEFLVVSSLFALLAGALYLLWPLVKTGPMALFTRIRPQAVLEHPFRQELVQAIEAEPGVHLHALSRHVDRSRSVTEHHLRRLVDTGQVVRRDAGGYTCYFPPGTDRRSLRTAPVLRSATARGLWDLVGSEPGIRMVDVAERLGVNRGTVQYHVDRMRDAGVLRVGEGERGRRLWQNPT